MSEPQVHVACLKHSEKRKNSSETSRAWKSLAFPGSGLSMNEHLLRFLATFDHISCSSSAASASAVRWRTCMYRLWTSAETTCLTRAFQISVNCCAVGCTDGGCARAFRDESLDLHRGLGYQAWIKPGLKTFFNSDLPWIFLSAQDFGLICVMETGWYCTRKCKICALILYCLIPWLYSSWLYILYFWWAFWVLNPSYDWKTVEKASALKRCGSESRVESWSKQYQLFIQPCLI